MVPKPDVEHRTHPYPSLVPATSQLSDVPKLQLVPGLGTCLGISWGQHIKLCQKVRVKGILAWNCLWLCFLRHKR